jgi:hypothetical protein
MAMKMIKNSEYFLPQIANQTELTLSTAKNRPPIHLYRIWTVGKSRLNYLPIPLSNNKCLSLDNKKMKQRDRKLKQNIVIMKKSRTFAT